MGEFLLADSSQTNLTNLITTNSSFFNQTIFGCASEELGLDLNLQKKNISGLAEDLLYLFTTQHFGSIWESSRSNEPDSFITDLIASDLISQLQEDEEREQEAASTRFQQSSCAPCQEKISIISECRSSCSHQPEIWDQLELDEEIYTIESEIAKVEGQKCELKCDILLFPTPTNCKILQALTPKESNPIATVNNNPPLSSLASTPNDPSCHACSEEENFDLASNCSPLLGSPALSNFDSNSPNEPHPPSQEMPSNEQPQTPLNLEEDADVDVGVEDLDYFPVSTQHTEVLLQLTKKRSSKDCKTNSKPKRRRTHCNNETTVVNSQQTTLKKSKTKSPRATRLKRNSPRPEEIFKVEQVLKIRSLEGAEENEEIDIGDQSDFINY